MQTLIINGSPRAHGATAELIGALRPHLPGEITRIDTYTADVSPCIDCRHCWTHPDCALLDGMQAAYRAIDQADVVVIASPVYFGQLTGPLLSWASRLQMLWVAQAFRHQSLLADKPRKGAVLLSCGDKGPVEGAIATAKLLLENMGAVYADSACLFHTDIGAADFAEPARRAIERLVDALK